MYAGDMSVPDGSVWTWVNVFSLLLPCQNAPFLLASYVLADDNEGRTLELGDESPRAHS